MNIQQALCEIHSFINFIEGGAFERRKPTKEEIGRYADNSYDALCALVSYVETIKAVHTDHDAQAEMEHWDDFINGRLEG